MNSPVILGGGSKREVKKPPPPSEIIKGAEARVSNGAAAGVSPTVGPGKLDVV